MRGFYFLFFLGISFLPPFPVILQNRCQFLGLLYLINTETGLIHGNCIVHIIFITFLPLIVFVFPLWFLSHWLIKFFLFDVLRYFGAYSFIKTHLFSLSFSAFSLLLFCFFA